MMGIRSGSQSVFQFILKLLGGTEVRAVCALGCCRVETGQRHETVDTKLAAPVV